MEADAPAAPLRRRPARSAARWPSTSSGTACACRAGRPSPTRSAAGWSRPLLATPRRASRGGGAWHAGRRPGAPPGARPPARGLVAGDPVSALRSALVAVVAAGLRPGRTRARPAQGRRPAPTATLSVSDFGARGDGQTLDTAAIQAAVDALPSGGDPALPAGHVPDRVRPGHRAQGRRAPRPRRRGPRRARTSTARAAGIFEIEGRRNVVISRRHPRGQPLGARPTGAWASSRATPQDLADRERDAAGLLLRRHPADRKPRLRARVDARRRGPEQPPHRPRRARRPPRHGGGQHASPAPTGSPPRRARTSSPTRGARCSDVRIRRCTFAGNAGVGLYVHRAKGDAVVDATVEDSVVEDNGHGIVMVERRGRLDRQQPRERPPRPGHVRRSSSRGTARRAVVTGNQLEGNFRGILSAGATGRRHPGEHGGGNRAARPPGPRRGRERHRLPRPRPRAHRAPAPSPGTPFAAVPAPASSPSRCRWSASGTTRSRRSGSGPSCCAPRPQRVEGNSVRVERPRPGGSTPPSSSSSRRATTSSPRTSSAWGRGAGEAIAVCPACRRNEVNGNVVLP